MSAQPPHELLAHAEPATAISKLVPVGMTDIGGQLVQSVNGSALHVFLEVGKDFSTWIKDRIEQYTFVENRDFVCSPILGSKGRGGHNRKEYHLSLSMAKELAMVERNAKGKEARVYFIECERRALAAPARPAELTRMDLIELAMAAERDRIAADAKVQHLEHQLADQAPAVAALDLIANAKGTQCITDAAKVLQMKPHELTDLLLQKKWMYHRPGKPGYIAYQDKLDSGHLKHKVHNYQDPESGEYRAKEQVLVTKKGLTKLAELLASEALARRAKAADQHQQRLLLQEDGG